MSQNQTEEQGGGIFEENLPAAIGIGASDNVDSVNEMILSKSVEAESQFITFTINNEEYGTPILKVQELRGWMKTTPLPNTPDYVKGVTNLRGNIVPVFDLRARFSGEHTKVTNRHVVVIVEVKQRTIGLLVDAISDILTIDEADIQLPPEIDMGIEAQYIDGLVSAGERMVALINIDKLFSTEMIEKLGETLSQ